MFSNLIRRDLSYLTLSAEQHNRLNAAMMPEIKTAMERHGWQCHRCNTALPGLMEIDHLKGHSLKEKDALAPICQTCHNLDHLLWAASRKLFIPIHAPDLSYEDLSQLTWSLILHQDQDGVNINKTKLMRDLIARREDAEDALGHDNVEALFETVLTLHKSGACDIAAVTEELDREIKLAPSLLFAEAPHIRTWSVSGFTDVNDSWRDDSRPNLPPYQDIFKVGHAQLQSL